MSKFIAAVFFISCTLSTFALSVLGSYRNATFEVCDRVEADYFRSRDEFAKEWLVFCRERAGAQPYIVSKSRTIFEINSLLSQLAVSHLFLYTPEENKAIWENEAVDTGLRAVNVEGEIIVNEVIAGSVGEKANVKVGDLIELINDQPVGQANYVSWQSGFFTIVRGEERFSVNIEPAPLAVNLGPRIFQRRAGVTQVRAQSFLANYFPDETWRPLAEKFRRNQHVILDLRGNAGGSFPAMLRVASAFYCEPELLGALEKNSAAFSPLASDLENNLNAGDQLAQLQKVSRLNLRSFKDYPCYRGNLTVLVDSSTASTAEILAEALSRRPKTRVWGTTTAGEVLMARWFPMPSLGPGDFSISIPIAGYISKTGIELENHGVIPSRILTYDINESKAAQDSWLLRAMNTPFEN